jgi:hypothetical protein
MALSESAPVTHANTVVATALRNDRPSDAGHDVPASSIWMIAAGVATCRSGQAGELLVSARRS